MHSDLPGDAAHRGLRRTATAVTLGFIVTAQWSLTRTLQNDVFVDEATYAVAGRLIHDAHDVHGAGLPAFATYFSGAPHLYPWLAAWADRAGGLEGARLTSFVCMVIAMLAVYVTSRQLFRDRLSGVLAAAIFAVQGPVLFLARLATFDAPSVALLSVAIAACACSAHQKRHAAEIAWLALAGACIGMASVVKYAALLYLPAVVLFAIALAPRRWLLRSLVVGLSALLVAGVLVSLGNAREIATGFLTTTLTRVAPSGGRADDILAFAAQLGGVVGLLAITVLVSPRPVSRWAVVTLLLFALAAPLNHARLHEFVSLHKHVAFSLVLLAPLAGRAVAIGARWIQFQFEERSAALALAVASVSLVLLVRGNLIPSINVAHRLFTYWPNLTRRAYLALRPVASPESRVLSEEPDIGFYYLGDKISYAHWTHPYFFDYNGAVAKGVSDDSIPRRAIRDGYFTAVVLRYGPQRAWAHRIEEELLRSQPRYRLAVRLPFQLADGPSFYEVWVRSDAVGSDVVR